MDLGGDFNMKKSASIPLLIIFILILVLSLLVYQQFKGLQQSLAEVNLPKFEIPDINSTFWSGEKEGYKEWTSPDGKLKMKYPSHWVETDESFKNYFFQSTEEAEVLFFASKFNLESLGALNFLVVEKLNVENNLEGIIEQMKKDAKESGGEIEITELNIGEKEAEFETEYKSKAGIIFYSKEKLLLAEEGVYSVKIFSQKNYWSKINNEAIEILDSLTLFQKML